MINKDLIVWLLTLGFFGGLGATARYINNLGSEDREFSLIKWLSETFVGSVVAIFVGLISKHFEFSDFMIYGLAGLAAIAAKEMIHTLPAVAAGALKRLGDKIK